MKLVPSGARLGAVALGVSAFAALAPVHPMQVRGGMTPVEIALVVAFLIISLGLHEAAHAGVANLCGDSTAKDLGRLTLNPIAHIDPFLTIILPAFLALSGMPIFGGAKPVPVNPSRLRHPGRDMMLVALAGPATNFVLALFFFAITNALLANGIYDRDQLIIRVLWTSAGFNVLLAVFNMLPVPPLDGSRVLAWLLPPGLREPYVAFERFGMLLVVFLVFGVPQVQRVIFSALSSISNWMNEVTWFYG